MYTFFWMEVLIVLRDKLNIANKNELATVIKWLHEALSDEFQILTDDDQQVDIFIVEVNKMFDWVRIRRLQRRYSKSLICPILAKELSFSSALAIDLKLQTILVKPLQKSVFLRTAKKLRTRYYQFKKITFTYSDLYEQITDGDNTPFQEAFLRRLIRGELGSEQEVIEARAFLPTQAIPNVVLLLQGFSLERLPNGIAPSVIIKQYIREQYNQCNSHTSFLSFQKHLLILLRVPKLYSSFKQWQQGVEYMLKVIQQLREEFGIYVYIGVGDVYDAPLNLHFSYGEARKARRKPAITHVQLRFFEEITKNPALLKTIDYIVKNCCENISISDAATYMNFSVPYFSRMFNKETKKSYVDYVTFLKIMKSLPLLRMSNQTMEQISADTGFNTPNYYSSTFKKYVGLSPSEYRATYEIIFK